MARKTGRVEASEPPAKRSRRRKTPTEISRPSTQESQGFLFDPYWDEAFSAYYDPTLRTCCQIKY